MAHFLARGGSNATSRATFWTGDAPDASSTSSLGITSSMAKTFASTSAGVLPITRDGVVRAAGVSGAYDEKSRPTVVSAKAAKGPSMSEHVHALYHRVKGERATHIPGYTGFVPGTKEIAGRSQTRTIARALTKTPAELLMSDPLPSDPAHKHSLARVQAHYAEQVLGTDMGSTLVGDNEAAARHVSGYTGHVPGLKECALGKTYGAITSDTLGGQPRQHKAERVALYEAGRDRIGFPHRMAHAKPVLQSDDPSLYCKYMTAAK